METKRRHLTFCGVKEDHKKVISEESSSRNQLSCRESISSHVHPVSTTLTLLDQGKTVPYGSAVCDVAQKGHFNVKKVPYEENLRHQALLQQQLHNLQQSYQHQYHKHRSMSKQWSEDCNFNKTVFNKVRHYQHRKHSVNIFPTNVEHSHPNCHHLKTRSLSSNVKYYSLSTLKLHTLDDAVGEVSEEEVDEEKEKKDLYLNQENEKRKFEKAKDNNYVTKTTDDTTKPVLIGNTTSTSLTEMTTTQIIPATTTNKHETTDIPLISLSPQPYQHPHLP